jgi:hypothetical protein
MAFSLAVGLVWDGFFDVLLVWTVVATKLNNHPHEQYGT